MPIVTESTPHRPAYPGRQVELPKAVQDVLNGINPALLRLVSSDARQRALAPLGRLPAQRQAHPDTLTSDETDESRVSATPVKPLFVNSSGVKYYTRAQAAYELGS